MKAEIERSLRGNYLNLWLRAGGEIHGPLKVESLTVMLEGVSNVLSIHDIRYEAVPELKAEIVP